MNDLSMRIFEKYGVRAIAVICIAFVIIWGVAHFMAAPGQEVSILWGLVEYTKREPTAAKAQLSSKPANQKHEFGRDLPPSPTPTKLPMNIFTVNDLSQKTASKAIEQMRSNGRLRELSTIESGKEFSQMPASTYGFVFVNGMNWAVSSLVSQDMNDEIISRYPDSDCYLEVHHSASDEHFLLVYLSSADASKIARLSGKNAISITASSVPADQFTSLASLPIDRITELKPRELDLAPKKSICVIDIKIM